MQLRPVARPPAAGLAVKPLRRDIAHAAKATVPNRASYGLRPLVPRISHSSAPRTKVRDEAERESQQAPAAKQGEDESAAERKAAPPPPGERSMAYQIFAGLYVCAYVFLWRTGELITVNAEEGLERLRRYVRDNFFNPKR